MRFFQLVNLQHIVIWIFPTLAFIILLGLFLGKNYFFTRLSKRRMTEITYRFPEGIEDRNAPFPLAMALVVVGTVLWGFFYILFIGLYGVKI